MDETLYCVWLQCVFGPGSPVPERVFQNYPKIRDFYDGGEMEWRLSGLFTQEQLRKLETTPLQSAVRILEECWRNKYRIISRSDKAYPKRLAQISSPPIALYVAGVWPEIDHELCIGIVGTRNATPVGVRNTAQIADGLSKAGAVIVSGGAVGIDTAAHKSTLLAGGRTISVLGCGLDSNYLPENRQMRNEIRQRGALVSEYPPGTAPLPRHFPIRNRIISGLSMGVIMVEGGEKSGAMITMRQALEQNRDVFVVVGEDKEFRSDGVKRLQEEGAKTISSAEEVLVDYAYWLRQQEEWLRAGQATELRQEEMPDLSELLEEQTEFPTDFEEFLTELSAPKTKKEKKNPETEVPESKEIPEKTVLPEVQTKKTEKKRKESRKRMEQPKVDLDLPDFLSEEAKKFAAVLNENPQHIDELAKLAGLSTRDALAAITELEMEGLISGLPGKLYVRK